MTLENMKIIAKENNGTIPAGMAMTMTDLEIKRAIKHGYLKEAPEKVQAPEPKEIKKASSKKDSKKATADKVVSKASKKDGQADKEADLPAPVEPEAAAVFSKEQKDTYTKLDGLIYDRMNDMKKSSFDIAFALHIIYENCYFKIDGYKNIYDYARERYGIARGTTNNFINLVDRFGDIRNRDLKPEFSDYSSTQLICMLGHTDEELKEKNITPSMSSRDIKKALRADTDSRAETVNSLNGMKSDLPDGVADDEVDSIEQEQFLYNVVFEMTKETFADFRDFGSTETSDTCVLEVLAQNVKVMTKLLLLGHRIQIIDILQ